MRRLKYLLIILALFLIPNTIKAEECSVSEMSRLKKIASNITSKYEYTESIPDEGYGSVKFKFTISNVTSDIYLTGLAGYYDQYGNAAINYYYPNKDNQIIVENQQDGKSYAFMVYGNTPNCKDDYITKIYITAPDYNEFYIHDLCKGIEDYKFCQKWVKTSYSEEEFERVVKKYIKCLEKTPNPDEPDPGDEWIISLISFLNKYIYLVIPVIVLCIIGILYLRSKDDFDFKIKNK